jgi:LysR family cyn operon transcriptional activator
MIDQAFAAAGIHPEVRVEMESVDALIRTCRHGDLATIAAQHAAEQASQLPDSPFCDISLTHPVTVRRAAILWRRGVAPSRAVQEFVATLQAAIPRLSSNRKKTNRSI